MRLPHFYSVSSLDLASIKPMANALKKTDGISHAQALEHVSQSLGFDSYKQAVELLRIPVEKDEFHRIRINNTVLIMHAAGDLYISEFHLPPATITQDNKCFFMEGQVVWGECTLLAESSSDASWWLCKYDSGQKRIALAGANTEQMTLLSELLAIRCRPNPRASRFRSEDRIQSAVFMSLRQWAARYPDLAADQSSTQFGGWGELALMPDPQQ